MNDILKVLKAPEFTDDTLPYSIEFTDVEEDYHRRKTGINIRLYNDIIYTNDRTYPIEWENSKEEADQQLINDVIAEVFRKGLKSCVKG
jgi:hypothetical protein